MAAIPDAGGVTPDRVLRRKRRAENFPVALRLLPRQVRADLVAVYDVVRVIDDLGDQATGDRVALLTEFRADLAAVWAGGRPEHPVLRRLVPTVRARGLDRVPFERLVQANLVDQRVHRYATYAQLRGYCALSAEPVGRIVLAVFEACSPARIDPAAIELSDRVCAALQLIEHWQDVAEDRRAGRVYLPQEDLAAFGVAEAELDGTVAAPALRRLMAFQVTRAGELLESGAPLVGLLRGWARLAVTGYLAGGRAALAALCRVDGDVLAGPPRPRRRDVLWHLGLGGLQGHQPPGLVALPATALAPGVGGSSRPPTPWVGGLEDPPTGERSGAVRGSVEEAFALCESITRAQARNFYYGIRLLPPDKRAGLCAVYALARRIDDIGDGDLPWADKLAALAQVRRSLADLDHPGDDPVLTAVADLARRLPRLPLGAFGELVDGVQMDVMGRHYADFDELAGYCRCVAGAVGRLCLAVFGHRPDPRAPEYADALGIALQQVNILRDIREDLGNGRVYLPRSDLDRFGVQLALDERNALVDADGRLSALIRHSAGRARQWYAQGMRLIPLLDRRSAACCTVMSGIYRRLLDRIDTQPSLVFDRRLSLPSWRKAEVAARALSGLPA